MKERKPSPHRRGAARHRRPEVVAATAAAWQRWLVGIVVLGIGAGAVVFGGSDLYGWIDALRRDAPVIRTGSAMFALPLFGIGFLSIAALGPMLRLAKGQRERWTEGAFGAAVGAALALFIVGHGAFVLFAAAVVGVAPGPGETHLQEFAGHIGAHKVIRL